MGGWILTTDFSGDGFGLKCWCCNIRGIEAQGIWETRRRPQREPEPPGSRSVPFFAITENPIQYADFCPSCRLLSEPELEATARRLARERLGFAAEDDEGADR